MWVQLLGARLLLLMVSPDQLLVSIGKEKVICAEGPGAPGFGLPSAPVCPFSASCWAHLFQAWGQ